MKLSIDLIGRAEKEYALSSDAKLKIRERIAAQPAIVLDGEKHYGDRKEMIAAAAAEDVADAFERYIGENNLLPINYLLLGYL